MKLKPCPFCGRKPIFYEYPKGSYYVECRNLKCSMCVTTPWKKILKTAIKAWNKRTCQQYRDEHDYEKAREKVLQAIGHVSVCWNKDGVFDSEQALKVGGNLLKDLGYKES